MKNYSGYTNEELVNLTKELTEMLRRNRTIDWNRRESERANMRRLVKRLLRKYKYPPEKAQDALETVLRQCEQWAEEEETIDNEPNLFARRSTYAFDEESAMPMAAENPS